MQLRGLVACFLCTSIDILESTIIRSIDGVNFVTVRITPRGLWETTSGTNKDNGVGTQGRRPTDVCFSLDITEVQGQDQPSAAVSTFVR